MASFQAKEGTVKVDPCMKRYLDKHMKSCLTKGEREAIFKEYSRPTWLFSGGRTTFGLTFGDL